MHGEIGLRGERSGGRGGGGRKRRRGRAPNPFNRSARLAFAALNFHRPWNKRLVRISLIKLNETSLLTLDDISSGNPSPEIAARVSLSIPISANQSRELIADHSILISNK